MTFIGEFLISLLLLAAGFFGLVGSFGLIKLDHPLTRLHAPTKATTLGVGSVLIASMLYFAFFGSGITFHELLISVFLFMTAPVVAHLIAKAYLHRKVMSDTLPQPDGESSWAVYADNADPRPDDRTNAPQ